MTSKGKGIADSSGKRKRGDDANGGKGRRKRSVLQFFEEATVEDCDGDSDSVSDDFFNEDFLNDFNNMDAKVKSEPGRFDQVPFLPKEEELSGDELEKMLEERYRRGSGYVRYGDEDYESKRSMDKSELVPFGEPTIWKVKCKVGREKNTVFCLIQKFVDLKVLGTKLQIISAFAVEHIKGFVFVEAERQSDVAEACNQLADVYFSLVTKVPSNEVGQLLVVKKRYNEVKEGTWARVKNGIYRGDLAQVVAVNNERKKATVKLIPRIDLQALTEKYGGGTSSKRTKGSIPAARLISTSDLEEFRPLIHYRRDRDTGKMFEFLDSLMLKDGFLYKKVSIESLSFWAVNPLEDELQKFTVSSNNESGNMEWLSQLYGEPKKKSVVNFDKGGGKGGGKGEGSSGSHEQSSFEVHDLVHFGKRDFGMIVGMEKDESYKILKDSSEGPVTLNLGQKDLKYVSLEKKFTAFDHRMKTISTNDTVRLLEGPIKGRQGIVKQVYRGVIFLYDENDLDNSYFCSKSQMSEKVKHSETACHGKDEGGPSNFEDVPSSPKSPLSSKKPWQRENNSDDRMGKDGIFSVGQSLRIRIGPLKGYLCRVLAVRYSDVTVKLDSQHKVFTVKSEHLSEVRGQNSASSIRDDPETSSPFKPFDLLGIEGNTNDWLQQASVSVDGDGWNVGGTSGDRGNWPAFPSSGASLQASTAATDLSTSAEDAAWLSKVVGNEKDVGSGVQVGVWGTSAGGWEKAKAPMGDRGSSWNMGGCSSGQGKTDNVSETDPWMEGQKITSATNCWGNQKAEDQPDSWNKGKRIEEQGGWTNIGSCGDSGSSGWGKQKTCTKNGTWGEGTESVEQSIGKGNGVTWAEPKCSSDPAEDSWGKAADGWGKKNNSSESSEWENSATASQSKSVALAETHTGWGQRQGQIASGGWKKSLDAHPKEIQTTGTGINVSETWTKGRESENKGSDILCDDPWGKAVNKLGDKGNEWGSSTNKQTCDNKGWGTSSGGWTNSQEQTTEAGGWKSSGDGSEADGWSKSKGFDADNKGGNDSWGLPKNSEDNIGFNRGRSPSGRGRGRGRDQSGRGRFFDRDQFSGPDKDNQGSFSSGNKIWKDKYGSSGGNLSVENGLTNWDKGKSWNDNKGDGCKGWNKSNESDKDAGGWSSKNWAKPKNSENDQELGWGQGSGGRRGGRGRELFGRGGGGRSGGRGGRNSEESSWSKGRWSSDKSFDENCIEGNSNKSWGSGHGAEGKGWSKAGKGGLSWGSGSNNQKGGWDNDTSRNTGGGSSYGIPPSGHSSAAGRWSTSKTIGENNVGGNSIKSWGSGDRVEGKGWSMVGEGKGEGGSSWGSGSIYKIGGGESDTSKTTGQDGSSWGKSSGPSSDAGGWGKSLFGTSSDAGDWGKSSSGPSSDAGGWGKSSSGPSRDATGWGKSSSGPSSDGGGWGKSSSGPSSDEGSWGKSSSGPSNDVGGWGKSSSGPSSDAGGWEKSLSGPSSDGGGWGKSSSGPSSDAGGWGKSFSGPSCNAGGW